MDIKVPVLELAAGVMGRLGRLLQTASYAAQQAIWGRLSGLDAGVYAQLDRTSRVPPALTRAAGGLAAIGSGPYWSKEWCMFICELLYHCLDCLTSA